MLRDGLANTFGDTILKPIKIITRLSVYPDELLLTTNSSDKGFFISIYLEHLSEASFLYEQRLSLLDDPEISWKDIDDFEQRFEAHIDGLVVGEDLALEVCKQQAEVGDFGELHAAMKVFCRLNRLDLIEDILKSIDPEDNEKITAVKNALKDEFSDKWTNNRGRLLKDNNSNMSVVLPEIIGYRRLRSGNELLELLKKNEVKNIPEILWALGRLRDQQLLAYIFDNYLQQKDELISYSAALALLRSGDLRIISYCLYIMEKNSSLLLLLGLSGNHTIIPKLLELGMSDKVSPECLKALGLQGDISAVDVLINYLNNKELSEPAALALNLITGAELYEEIFIPEKIDEDELFDEEKEKLKAGESLYPPGEEPGKTIQRLSQKRDEWINWWSNNKSRFKNRARYRNGNLYSPACLLENLESEKLPREIRQLVYEEFVIRYNIDFPFETDMTVVKQLKAIDLYKKWVSENETRFNKGQWYFAGKVQ